LECGSKAAAFEPPHPQQQHQNQPPTTNKKGAPILGRAFKTNPSFNPS
jgi:hypothetical protein